MIGVSFNPEDDIHSDWFPEWKKTADAETVKVIGEFDEWLLDRTKPKPDFEKGRSKIWTELKQELRARIFNEKCAYCETKFLGFFPDAEHFRPKSRVAFRDDAGKRHYPMVTLPNGEQIEHPGYYWLAFHWKNLVPSCKTCNTGSGKGTLFPTGKGHYYLVAADPTVDSLTEPYYPCAAFPGYYYLSPEDLDNRELTYLLNPLNTPMKIAEHLVFGVRGIVAARDESPFGKHSIATYNLEYEELRKARQRVQEDAWRQFCLSLAMELEAKAVDTKPLYAPDLAYSEAVRQYLATRIARLQG